MAIIIYFFLFSSPFHLNFNSFLCLWNFWSLFLLTFGSLCSLFMGFLLYILNFLDLSSSSLIFLLISLISLTFSSDFWENVSGQSFKLIIWTFAAWSLLFTVCCIFKFDQHVYWSVRAERDMWKSHCDCSFVNYLKIIILDFWLILFHS